MKTKDKLHIPAPLDNDNQKAVEISEMTETIQELRAVIKRLLRVYPSHIEMARSNCDCAICEANRLVNKPA